MAQWVYFISIPTFYKEDNFSYWTTNLQGSKNRCQVEHKLIPFFLIFDKHGISDMTSAAQIAPSDQTDITIISLVYKVLLEIWIKKVFISFAAPKTTCKVNPGFFIIEMLHAF